MERLRSTARRRSSGPEQDTGSRSATRRGKIHTDSQRADGPECSAATDRGHPAPKRRWFAGSAATPYVGGNVASEVVGLLISVGLVTWSALIATKPEPGSLQQNLFRLVNELPSGAAGLALGITQLGALGAVVVVAAVALIGRRTRLAQGLVLAGVCGWGLAKALQALIGTEPPDLVVSHVVLRGASASSGGFPSTHVVAAALVSVASPYLRPGSRRLAWLGVVAVGVARIYVGAHLPIDIAGGLVLGWGVGVGVRLIMGSPRSGPTPNEVRAALEGRGIGKALRVQSLARWGPDSWRASTFDAGEVFIRVVGPDQEAQGLIQRLWHFVAYRDAKAVHGTGSSQTQMSHAAHAALIAEQTGVRTPHLVRTATLSEHSALLARIWIPGHSLNDLGPDDLDDAVLADLWSQLLLLHAAGVAHGDLRPDKVIVDPAARAWLIDINGIAQPDEPAAARDRAELLVGIAQAVGTARAVTSARDALGTSGLLTVLSFLQPLALSPATRIGLRASPSLVPELREAVAAETTVPPPALERPIRVATRNLLPLLFLGVAVYVLLPKVVQGQHVTATLGQARWEWLVLSAAFTLATYLAGVVALTAASGMPLPFFRSLGALSAAAFTNRLIPAGLGGMATTIRYLERSGSDAAAATATIAAASLTGFLVRFIALSVAVTLSATRNGPPWVPGAPDHALVLVLIAGAALVVSCVLILKFRLWQRGVSTARLALTALVSTARTPSRMLTLLAAEAGITTCYTAALAASLEAFGVHIAMMRVIAAYLGASAVAAATPTPGGLGPLEAALVAALGFAGAPAAPVVAAVLTYRLISYWLPVIPGALAFRYLRKGRAL